MNTTFKTAVITGASGDIGKALCFEFAKNGYSVAMIYHNDLSAVEFLPDIQKIAPDSKCYRCDLSNEEQVKTTSKKILSDFDRIDVIINNAGISYSGLVTDFSGDDFDKIFSVNVKSMFMLNNALIGRMIHQKSGCIINMSSIWGQVGASCEVLYSATKAAMIGYTKALAAELGPSNVRVNNIAPGYIDTKMNSEYSDDDKAEFANDTPLCKIGDVGDIAKSALFLASDNAKFITGQTLGVNGGYVMM